MTDEEIIEAMGRHMENHSLSGKSLARLAFEAARPLIERQLLEEMREELNARGNGVAQQYCRMVIDGFITEREKGGGK